MRYLNAVAKIVEGNVLFLYRHAVLTHEQNILKLGYKLVGEPLFVECRFVIFVVSFGVADYAELVFILRMFFIERMELVSL